MTKKTLTKKNELIVLGTIHSQHKTTVGYGLSDLEAIVKTLNPDVILAEIPADRFKIAKKEFETTGIIKEPRILQYPEFSHVVFPLQKELNFELFPVSAWTEKMADERDIKLKKISLNPKRQNDWDTYLDAREKTSKLFEKANKDFDPVWINSNEFDTIMNIELSVFDELFNIDLGAGGWTNINNAHYRLIDTQLNAFKNHGKRILIMFGAGHKGWLIKKLKTRTDIELKPLLSAL